MKSLLTDDEVIQIIRDGIDELDADDLSDLFNFLFPFKIQPYCKNDDGMWDGEHYEIIEKGEQSE